MTVKSQPSCVHVPWPPMHKGTPIRPRLSSLKREIKNIVDLLVFVCHLMHTLCALLRPTSHHFFRVCVCVCVCVHVCVHVRVHVHACLCVSVCMCMLLFSFEATPPSLHAVVGLCAIGFLTLNLTLLQSALLEMDKILGNRML